MIYIFRKWDVIWCFHLSVEMITNWNLDFFFFFKYIIKAVKMFTNRTNLFINRSLTLFFWVLCRNWSYWFCGFDLCLIDRCSNLCVKQIVWACCFVMKHVSKTLKLHQKDNEICMQICVSNVMCSHATS